MSLDDLLDAVAVALGTDLGVGADRLDRAFRALVSRAPGLLGVDNLEQCLEPARTLLDAVRRRAPDVAVLATSRVRVGAQGEALIELAPLSTQEAAAMFVQCARDATRTFRPDADTLSSVERLVTALEGLPLAIESTTNRERWPWRAAATGKPSTSIVWRTSTMG